MTVNVLKIIACITMLIGHFGNLLYYENLINYETYLLMFCISRIAFPIFGYLIIEGYKHTHDLKKYIIRLMIFALISQPPFNIVQQTIFDYSGTNVIFEFLIFVLGITLIEKFENKYKTKIIEISVYILMCLLSYGINSDYTFWGIIYLIILYKIKNRNLKMILSIILVIICCINQGDWYQSLCLLAIPLLFLYNGKLGKKNKLIQYGFYIFYPAHLMLICFFL